MSCWRAAISAKSGGTPGVTSSTLTLLLEAIAGDEVSMSEPGELGGGGEYGGDSDEDREAGRDTMGSFRGAAEG